MLKRTIFSLFFILCAGAVFSQSQHLTRIAVVDMQRIYNEFFQESRDVRALELRTAEVQTEINRRTQEIQDLRTSHQRAINAGNQTEAARLEREVNNRTEELRNYHSARTAELDAARRNLQTNTFINIVRDEIRYVAEAEAYHFVFDSNSTTGLIYYNPMHDLTDKVIQNLRVRGR
ncbi:MAG: OmpH family outer membrane protein [Treponema sp.]|nr:OmpH family outer membrane protein [Treponema sp.]